MSKVRRTGSGTEGEPPDGPFVVGMKWLLDDWRRFVRAVVLLIIGGAIVIGLAHELAPHLDDVASLIGGPVAGRSCIRWRRGRDDE